MSENGERAGRMGVVAVVEVERVSSEERAVMASQRARILRAMAEVTAERGFADVSAALVCRRAEVSRGAFHKHFAGVNQCFVAVMDDGAARAGALMLRAFAGERSWLDGMRAAIAALLVLLESEPVYARVWQLEALSAGVWALEHRERRLAELLDIVIQRWAPSRTSGPQRVAAEGVMAAVLGLIQTRLLTPDGQPLLELLGPIMGVVTAPFADPASCAREIGRGAEVAHAILAGRAETAYTPAREPAPIPSTLIVPAAHRARACIRHLQEHPGSSNRQIATAIGLTHQGQVSTLLSRLLSLGLLVKRPAAPGHSNAWQLSPAGEHAARELNATLATSPHTMTGASRRDVKFTATKGAVSDVKS